MSVIRTLSAVGAALVGTISASEGAAPPADPAAVRELLAEIGMLRPGAGDAEATQVLTRFQRRTGLVADGVAGPRTVQELARYAREARHMRAIGLAA